MSKKKNPDNIQRCLGMIEATVKSLSEDMHEMRHDLNKIWAAINRLNEAVAGLKVKSGIWGLVGGMIPAIVALMYIILRYLM